LKEKNVWAVRRRAAEIVSSGRARKWLGKKAKKKVIRWGGGK